MQVISCCPVCSSPLGDGSFCIYCYIKSRRCNKSYIKDGPSSVENREHCPECHAPIVLQGQCRFCPQCGWGVCS